MSIRRHHDFTIRDNKSSSSADLDSLMSVSSTLGILDNNELSSLTGLDSLTSVDWDLLNLDNNRLVDLTALHGLARVDAVDIRGQWARLGLPMTTLSVGIHRVAPPPPPTWACRLAAPLSEYDLEVLAREIG